MNIHIMHCYVRQGQWEAAYRRLIATKQQQQGVSERGERGGGYNNAAGNVDGVMIGHKVRVDLEKSFGWNCHIAILQFENHHYAEALKAAEAAKKAITTPSTTSGGGGVKGSSNNNDDHHVPASLQPPSNPITTTDEPYFQRAWVNVIIAWCRGLEVSSSANFNKLKYVMEHEWQDVVDLD
ncbi:hypothetical protein FOZ62_019084, partial [Perkinsus olseni]